MNQRPLLLNIGASGIQPEGFEVKGILKINPFAIAGQKIDITA